MLQVVGDGEGVQQEVEEEEEQENTLVQEQQLRQARGRMTIDGLRLLKL